MNNNSGSPYGAEDGTTFIYIVGALAVAFMVALALDSYHRWRENRRPGESGGWNPMGGLVRRVRHNFRVLKEAWQLYRRRKAARERSRGR
jgi:hypothetical protein